MAETIRIDTPQWKPDVDLRTQYVEEISRHIICENLGGYEGVEDLIDEQNLSTSAETVKQIMYAIIPPPLTPVKEMSMLHDRFPRISFILWTGETLERDDNRADVELLNLKSFWRPRSGATNLKH